MQAVVTADIILLPIIVTAIAVGITIVAYLDLAYERKKCKKAEDDMMWWAGLFLRLSAELMKQDGYTIRVEPGGEIQLIRKDNNGGDDLSEKRKRTKDASTGPMPSAR